MIPSEIIKKIKQIEIRTKRLVNDLFGGEYHSAFKGAGMEFSEVRSYIPGDDIREIDWNVTARTGTPYIKKFKEERELTVMLMIDISGSSYYGTGEMLKSDLMIEIASILSFSAIKNNDKVGLLLFSDKIEKYIPANKGKTHVLRVIREVINFKPENTSSNINIAIKHLQKVLKRKSIIFILSDFWSEGYETTMKILNKKHDLINVNINDSSEKKLHELGFIKIEDAESKKSYWIDLNKANIKTISNNVKKRFNAFNDFCRKNKIDLININSKDNYIEPIINFFNSRIHK